MLLDKNTQITNELKVLSHRKNDDKSFKFTLKDGKLIDIKIYHSSGEILNETRLVNGKIVSYKIYEEIENGMSYAGTIETGQSLEMISKLEHEVLLGSDKTLSHCKFYDLNTGKITYEGGFIDGKKTGYGKKFYGDGNILYDGYFLNDLMDGEGSLYHENGNIKYNGKFLKGKKNGHGITFFDNGNKNYEGKYCMGMAVGDVQSFYSNGNVEMDGRFDFDCFKGIVYNIEGTKKYEGEMTIDSERYNYQKHGSGICYWPNGNIEYSGYWANNKADGYGTLNYQNGKVKYNGQFKLNLFDGVGAKFDESGHLMCEGQWQGGKLESITLTDEQQLKGWQAIDDNDRIYVGSTHNGKKTGHGEFYWKSSGLRFFEGNFANNMHLGLCKQYYYENQINNAILDHIGYKVDSKWNGRLYFYYENGKFSSRVFNRKNKYLETFRVSYKKNGEIDLEKSYKGVNYMLDDFRREHLQN